MEHQTTRSARVIQVIETVSTRGKGEESDPVREVTQYWSLAGAPLAEHDPTIDVRAAVIEVKIGETFGIGNQWSSLNPTGPASGAEPGGEKP